MNSQRHTSGEQLENAFEQFNQFSERLVDSYGGLESQVALLSHQLSEAKSERLIQLAEKEVLAKRLEGLLDALPAGIVVLDAEDCINETNPVAREMLGSDLHGSKWENIAQNTIITDGDEQRLADGRWVNVSTCPLDSGPGKIILITDITETHELQDMLSRQHRLSSLGEMAACLAHQIRTPLSSALLYVSNVNHPMNKDEQRVRFANKAKKQMLYLERMVNDMLLFVKGDVAESEYIEISEFVSQLKFLLEPNDEVEKIVLIVDENVTHKTIRANRDALFSVIQNIVDNASQSCGDDQKISLEARLNVSDQLELTIKDNGCGMTDETKEKIFEPFYTTKTSGNGLGLSVVSTTVKQYGGDISVSSEEGIGSCFTIVFPCVEMTGALPSNLVASHIKTNEDTKHVVLDQQALRKQLSVIYGKGGK